MPVEEEKSTTKQRTTPSCRSFFDLPFEIRYIIYKLCLTDEVNGEKGAQWNRPIIRFIGPATPIIGSRCPCSQSRAIIVPNIDADDLPHMLLESSRHGPWKPAGLVVALLRVNNRIHDEAARVLYGDNTFEFQIGIHRHHWHIPNYSNMCRQEYFDFIDNFLDLAPQYLRMVKRCSLRIRLLTAPFVVARPTYLRALEGVTLFAEILSKGHSLQKLSASLVENGSHVKQPWTSSGRELSFFENVLEPLGILHGIRAVRIENVTPVFEMKLTMALAGPEVACTLAEEVYGTKKVKFKGRKRYRLFRANLYYESRYIWKPYYPVARNLERHVDAPQEEQLSEKHEVS